MTQLTRFTGAIRRSCAACAVAWLCTLTIGCGTSAADGANGSANKAAGTTDAAAADVDNGDDLPTDAAAPTDAGGPASDADSDNVDDSASGGPAGDAGDSATDALGGDVPDDGAPPDGATDTGATDTGATDTGATDTGAKDTGADTATPPNCSAAAALWDQLLGHAAGAPLRVAAMSDGGLAAASSGAGKAEILRRSSTGGAAWSHTFQPANGAQANALAAWSGGSLLVAGQRGVSAKPQGWLAALDAKGQVLWQHTVQYAEVFNGATVLSDGPLKDLTLIAGKPVAVGHHPAPSGSGKTQSSLTWFDTTGKITAQDAIYLGGSTRAEAVSPWEQGGVVVAGVGYSNSADGDVFVTTWVSPGNPGGTHGIVQVFPTAGQEQVTGVVSLGKGRVAVAGRRTLGGQTSLLLMLLDGTGKTVSQLDKTWNKAPATAAHGLWRSSFGGLVVAAEAAPAGGLQGSQSAGWLLEFDPGGDIVWERDLGDPTAADYIAAVAALPDDKLAVVGASGGVLRALRTSPWGHASCSAAGKCAALTLQSCSDGKPCTAALCDATAGCQAPAYANGTPCPAGVCSVGVCGP